MILRPYQHRAIESLRNARRQGHRRLLLALPTGGGKTITAIAMIQNSLRHEQRILVVAHRKELLDQFYGALYAECIRAGLIRADDERTDPTLPVQLASVASLARRDRPPADLVIVDEAHRTPGESYQRILACYPKATIIGLTATPSRLSGEPLSEHFDVLVEGASYSELIESGAIVSPIVYAPRREVNLSKVPKVHGDYHEGELERAMRQPHVIGDVVKEWKEKSDGRSTVVFAVGIAHSQELCEEFKAAGVRAAHIDGTTPEDTRIQILVALETNKLDVVCNVGVLCEGWDQPKVKYCAMARPTLSLTLHMQTAGRILRPWGDKPPLLLDHAGNVERHGLPHEDRVWSIDGKVKRKGEIAYHICKKCYAYVDVWPCPLCGCDETRAQKRVLRKDPLGVLERIDAHIAKERADPKRAYFDARVAEASRKGFKPGYASAKWKEKYGEWPPWEWSRAVHVDDEWQQRISQRERERSFWQTVRGKSDEVEP